MGEVTKTARNRAGCKLTFLRAATCAAVVLCAGGAFAALTDVRTWTDATGNHIWGDKNNWEPKVADSTRNIFPAGRDWEVCITQSDHYYFSFELGVGKGTVTFTGDTGALIPGTGAFIQIGAGRELKIDGPTIYMTTANVFGTDANGNEGFINGTLRLTSGALLTKPGGSGGDEQKFGGTAKVVVEGGTFGRNDGIITLTNNATMVVSGGLAKAQRWFLRSPDAPGESITRLRLQGGTLWDNFNYSYMFRVSDGAHFDFRGGTLIWGTDTNFRYNCLSSLTYENGGQGAAFPEFLPKQGASLVIPSAATNTSGAIYFAVDGDYEFDGDIYATNSVTTGGVVPGFIDIGGGKTVKLTGGGRIYANGFTMPGNYTKLNLDVSAIYLGSGGIKQTGSTCETHILNDLVLGAWDDWSAIRGPNGYFTFAGDLTFDTLNCFDKTTTHTITMKAGFVDVTSLKAVGGGTVALWPNIYANQHPAWPVLLRSLAVGDNTSLFITNSTEAIRTSVLALGAGSTLTFDLAANRYIDVLGKLEVGSNARIVAKLPASLTAGKIYPVFCAPVGVAVPNDLVEFDDVIPSGWTLVKRSNLVYLSDGEVAATTAPEQYYKYWSGAEDGDIENANNWTGADSPLSTAGSTKYTFAVFGGTKNMDVVAYNPITVYGLCAYANAGPFILSGEKITIFSPASGKHREGGTSTYSGILNSSDFPCVVGNELVHNVGGSTETYLATSYQLGSISLLGDNPKHKDVSEFYFCGDVRIGGDWTVSRFNTCTNYYARTAKRAHTLTLLPGASLSVTDQDEEFDYGQKLIVSQDSSLTVGGSICRFLVPNTNFIDGTLTFAGALEASAKQAFFGDGTNIFQSATGELDFKGAMTLIPGSLVDDVTVSLRGESTIAPVADWTYGGDATLNLDDHSTLTLATGGHKLTLAKPLVSKGDLAVTGAGQVEIAADGMSLGKVTCADGATLTVAAGIAEPGRSVDVLTVREDDASIAFAPEFKVAKRYDEETGRTIYSVKRSAGFVLIMK